jgi:hypothetical protein
MAAVLEYGSILRRICAQAAKAAAYLDRYLTPDLAPEAAVATAGEPAA